VLSILTLDGTAQTNEETLTFTNRQGRVYTNVTIRRVAPNGLIWSSEASGGLIPTTNLPAALREKFGLDTQAALEFDRAKAAADSAYRAAESAKLAKQKRDDERAKSLRRKEWSFGARVSQKVTDGLLIYNLSDNNQYLIVDMDMNSVADGDEFYVTTWPCGEYQYTTVQGAERTIHKLTVKSENAILPGDPVPQVAKVERKEKDLARNSDAGDVSAKPEFSGTGFFITEDGFLVTNAHVVRDGTKVRVLTSAGLIAAKVIKVDSANDLALLKAEGKFAALPVAASRAVKLGGTVATVGFPNIGLQGFAPKLAKGEIASLSGASDDPRYFQISVPVQPGNSGGALVDERGNVVGVVSAKLNALTALSTSGELPENVNYAVKSSFLLGFLESVPEVSAKLKEPKSLQAATPKFEDVVKSEEQAAVLVLVY